MTAPVGACRAHRSSPALLVFGFGLLVLALAVGWVFGAVTATLPPVSTVAPLPAVVIDAPTPTVLGTSTPILVIMIEASRTPDLRPTMTAMPTWTPMPVWGQPDCTTGDLCRMPRPTEPATIATAVSTCPARPVCINTEGA